jgi:hypothetical protein
MSNEINPNVCDIYSQTLQSVCDKHKKTLGNNFASIFNALEEVCTSLEDKDFNLGNLYNKFCGIVKEVVHNITTPVAKFIYDLASAFIDSAKANGKTVPDNRIALIESATSMADSANYIEINENNRLAYYYMSENRQEAWCAGTVTTLLRGIPGFDSAVLDEIGNTRSVPYFKKWAEKKQIYNDVSGLKSESRANFVNNSVKAGDLVLYKGASHIGIVVEIYPNGYTDPNTGIEYPPGSFKTVEGNTSDKLAYTIYRPNSGLVGGFIDMSRYLDSELVLPSVGAKNLTLSWADSYENSNNIKPYIDLNKRLPK